jgi:uncharacterized protein RhaS with RHS repeats
MPPTPPSWPTTPSANWRDYKYDAAGNAIRLTDADGQIADIQYDAMNRPVSAQDQEGNSVATAYDLNGADPVLKQA